VKVMMIKFIVALSVILALLLNFVGKSYSLDIYSMADQSTLRCRGGVVATGDSDSSVLKKCGEPQRVTKISGYGPIWIYKISQSKFMYYMEFEFGNLQRIASAPCSSNDTECYDLR
jgi:hypothetical protein